MNTPIIVIIPVYNAEKYLEAAVRSVLDQPYNKKQLVLVDDGSRDSSGALCDRLKESDSRISVLHQSNGGVSKARNAGLDFVLGQETRFSDDSYVTFLDADDFWKKDMKWSVKDGEGADIIGFSSALCNAKANRFKYDASFEDGVFFGNGADTTQWGKGGPIGSFLYRVGFLREKGLRFMEGIKRNEDIIFWKQATFLHNKIAFSSEVLYIYRMNPASVTHSTPVSDADPLHIPRAWNKAAEWGRVIPGLTEEQRALWIRSCSRSVGATLLEKARLLAEEGYAASEIKRVLFNGELDEHLDTLEVEWLAHWQQNDLLMLRNNLEEFVKYHNKKGKWKKIAISISRFKPVRGILDYRKFNLTEL